MSKQSEKLKAYRQACFVVTDMDRDDPEDVVRAWEAMQARVEQLQAEVKTWMDREAVVCPVCYGAGKDRWGICGECKGVGAKQKGDEG